MDLEFLLTISFNVASGQPRLLQLSQQMFFMVASASAFCRNIFEQSHALSRKRFVTARKKS